MARHPIFNATLQAALLGAVSNVLAQLITANRNKVRTSKPIALSMTGRKGRGEFDGVRGTVADSLQTEMAIDWIPVFQFLLYSVVNTPPNFLWQELLESVFPSHPSSGAKPKATQASKARDEGKEKKQQKKSQQQKQQKDDEPPLSLRNTLAKFLLDNTLGAAVNTLLFSTFIHALRAAMRPAPRITNLTRAVDHWTRPGSIDFAAVDGDAVWAAARAEFWPIVLAGVKFWPLVSLVNFSLVKTVEGRNLVGCLAGVAWGVYMSMFAAQ
ncbi:uncharacterized protein PCL_00217 [Purpureocillium lilacinum]|uniref:Mpv17/PMP22 family protein n=1 Tax=Purpureocillium lilacinum TaxID=33203 RepID=A0A2U3E6F1_PURLI|nr:uncharacterized protein PCL_00217 [Purpureocillium lilacinum]